MCAQHCARRHGESKGRRRGCAPGIQHSRAEPFDAGRCQVGVTCAQVHRPQVVVHTHPHQAVEVQGMGLGPGCRQLSLQPGQLLPCVGACGSPAQGRLVTHTGVTSVECKTEPAAPTPTISWLGGADHPEFPQVGGEVAMARVTHPSHVPLIQASALAASPHAGCVVPNGITACQTKQQDS